MRIVLISGIVFVHVPHDPANSPFLGSYGFIDWIRVFLGDSLFRVGVPCLSAISGYLLFRRGFDGFHYGKTLRTKAVTVLLPFLLWNLMFLGFVMIAQSLGIGFGYLPDVINATPREMASFAFALEDWPIDLPLYFLRDLLLCLVLSPVLGILMQRYPRATLIVFLAYAVLPVPNGIFLKKSILFGFSAGIGVALHHVNLVAIDRHAKAIFAVVFAATIWLSVGLYVTGPEFPLWLDMARSLIALTGILGAWALSALLVGTLLGQRLSRGGGLSFWIFCAHYPLLIVFWMIWNRLGIDTYPLFYVAAPILAIALLTLSHAAAQSLFPRLHAVLTGNRIGGKARLSAPPSMQASGTAKYAPQQR
ncbi:succinoglycan biosynthesis protein ExoH [Pararhizobium capsulatum DSM 1112]|uniref:Succinoglycan biosynthesis protein ExoH n=2 Tax=Pararhizobium capsulatum TaxID=34014 RepID=A0ABU0C082_9HYPH|nr:succinoglycan biosynthesis protein ExoH [Pararhizobium capsulatum DSM 1112]